MDITIKCNCGNEICVPVLSRKLVVLKDNLQNKFDIINVNIEKNQLKEFQIQCKRCKEWITLNFD